VRIRQFPRDRRPTGASRSLRRRGFAAAVDRGDLPSSQASSRRRRQCRAMTLSWSAVGYTMPLPRRPAVCDDATPTGVASTRRRARLTPTRTSRTRRDRHCGRTPPAVPCRRPIPEQGFRRSTRHRERDESSSLIGPLSKRVRPRPSVYPGGRELRARRPGRARASRSRPSWPESRRHAVYLVDRATSPASCTSTISSAQPELGTQLQAVRLGSGTSSDGLWTLRSR